jgi:hypothetical protein
MSDANLIVRMCRRLGRTTLLLMAGGSLVFFAGCGGEKNPETFDLKSGAAITRKVKFDAGTKVQIWVTSEHKSDVDLFVYDEKGNPVVKDEEVNKDCHVIFTPESTQKFKIEVQNRVLKDPGMESWNRDNRCTLKWEPKRQ